ncbi:MAG: hypothetical protein ABGY71_11200, partial [bacterium]
ELVGRDANRQVAPREAIDWVLIDSRGVRYGSELDKERLEALGLAVVDVDLAGTNDETLDPIKLVEALLTLV